MKRALVPALGLPGSRCRLDADTSKHLAQVMRLSVGDTVQLFDGQGLEARARIVSDDRRAVEVEVLEAPVDVRLAWSVHLLIGIPKGPAMDLAVRGATEAGVTHIHPVLCERAVPRDGRPDRWARIAASAAAQCGRADTPHIFDAQPWPDALEAVAAIADRRLAAPGAPRGGPATGDVAVAVGPEGGFTDAEVAMACQAGFAPMGLGPWILRACTAAPLAVATVMPAS